jgi:biotin carboxyl carrier protein
MALRNITMFMSGMVLDVKVKPGDKVGKKQVLMTVEAMKMKTPIFAPVAGTVKEIAASPGQILERDHLLAVIEEE